MLRPFPKPWAGGCSCPSGCGRQHGLLSHACYPRARLEPFFVVCCVLACNLQPLLHNLLLRWTTELLAVICTAPSVQVMTCEHSYHSA